MRRKGNVAGLWLNTASATFDNVPSYYAVASTRPIDEIAPEEFRALHGVGLKHLKYTPAVGQSHPLSSEDIRSTATRSCASSARTASTSTGPTA